MSRFTNWIRRTFTNTPPVSNPLTMNWMYGNQTIGTDSDTYDNLFPYINSISQRFATIRPYATSDGSTPLDPQPVAMQALYRPNNMMSGREFLYTISSSILTQTHLDILVWTSTTYGVQPGGQITPDNIIGYTILPPQSRQYSSNMADWTYQVTMADNTVHTFTRSEVLSLTYSHHPADLTIGVSPAMTVSKWATVDDMIADYQRGFFSNGAIPAGMMSITAENSDDYTHTKDRLEHAFQGAANNNSVVYNMRPIDPATGTPSTQEKLTWTPFQQPNNTLDLNTINSIVSTKLAGAINVPDIIRGIDHGQTYSNAQTAERAFTENTLDPLCALVWDKFQFELDRVTGGLGYAITYQLDLPVQSDIEHVQAETQQIQTQTFISLVQAGATPEQAASALNLPDTYREITLTTNPEPEPEPTQNPVTETPEPPTLEPLKKTSPVETPSQKLAANSRKLLHTLTRIAKRHTNSLTNNETTELDNAANTWIASSISILTAIMLTNAETTGRDIIKQTLTAAESNPTLKQTLTSMSADTIKALYTWDQLPDNVLTQYRQHLQHAIKQYVSYHYQQIQDILNQAATEQWPAPQLSDALNQYCDGQASQMIAENETTHSQRLAGLYAAENITRHVNGINISKQWKTTSKHPCPFCEHMDGTIIPITSSFMQEGDSITINDTTYGNDYEDKIVADGHPNCRCVLLYHVESESVNV